MTSPLEIRDARPADVPSLIALVHELAEYERMSHLVTATAGDYHAALFGPGAHAGAALAFVDGSAVGYMVWFRSFSTFRARSKVYLEDLFVRPSHRGQGIGKALLSELARRTLAAGAARLEWVVLDWNTPAIDFYHRLGAEVSREWLSCILDGAPLEALARLRSA